MNHEQHVFTSINRHTIQSILHIALSETPCHFGILASNHKHTINICSDNLATNQMPTMQTIFDAISDSEHSLHQHLCSTISSWQSQGIQALGFFYSCALSPKQAMQLEQLTQQYLKHQKAGLHLHILLDTKGRLDTQAWVLHNGHILPIPLNMTEDGNFQ